MKELKNNLNEILIEKQTKVLPDNIKEGVTIFGITGTVNAESFEEYTRALALSREILGTVTQSEEEE